MSEIKRKKDEKKKILEEQLNIIHSEKNKVDAVMLGGTDLALVYNPKNVDFALVDCAAVHVEELFRLHSN